MVQSVMGRSEAFKVYSFIVFMRVFIGLGTNLGDRQFNLVQAKDWLMKYDVLVLGQSSVLETHPLDGLDQPMYLNQVVECQTELSPMELLTSCKAIEKQMGRPIEFPPSEGLGLLGNVSFGANFQSIQKPATTPSKPRVFESRVIDLDILFYGDWILREPLLTIPHHGIAERSFVLNGLCELAPDFIHPILQKPLKALVSAS